MLVNSPGKSRDIQEHLERVLTLSLVSLGLVTVCLRPITAYSFENIWKVWNDAHYSNP